MAIEIRETFEVAAPIDAVWRFLMDPHRIVTCMPGAELEEVVDERTFLGTVKVKVGAINARYRGRIEFAEVDEAGHSVRMKAEGREAGGGTARGSIAANLASNAQGGTRVTTEASIDVTGRLMQMGRGMIEGVSKQLFQEFVASTREQIEGGGEAGARAAAGAAPIRVVPLVFRTLWRAVVDFVRRLFGRSTG